MNKSNTIYNDLSVPTEEPDANRTNGICKSLGQIPARMILYCMSLSGFMVSYMLRTDMNVAIVSMVKQAQSFEILNSSCSSGRLQYSNETEGNYTWKNVDVEIDYDERLDWSSDIQSYVLAAFYWTYLASQILGAMLAARFGSKFVYGAGQFLTAICTLLIPVACDRHYAIVIFLRSLQGFFSGVTWPAMFNLMAIWVPVPERTRFVSCLQGYNLGIGLNYPLCGYLITYLGWKSVFYTTGTVGVAWSIVWYFLVFDSPNSHPRISAEERRYINENTADVVTKGKGSVPWLKILTSMPVWAITISGFGWIWVNYVFIIGGPTYLSHVQGFNIRQSGILSGAPFLVSFPVALIFCYMADRIITWKWITVTNTRKMFTCLGQVVPGVMIIIIGYLACDTDAIIAVWFVAVTMPTAMYAGTMPNITEIAPSYAGHVVAVVQTIYMFASFISPLVTGYLTRDGNTVPAWQTIFNLSAGLSITTYVIYAVWGTAKIQPWNAAPPPKQKQEEEKMLDTTVPVIFKNGDHINGKQNHVDEKF